MLTSKKENRYNAYMKKTENGIIVKTVDSVTGFENLIKFTSDPFSVPRNAVVRCPSKPGFKSSMKRSREESSNVVKKFNNLRPYLRELETNISGFNIYEDSCSSLDIQNPKIIFVANSQIAKENAVNLNIPGELMDVCYKSDSKTNGTIYLKAKSFIKPLTIVIGDYLININVCHNLIPDKPSENHIKPKQQENESPTDCSSQNLQLSNINEYSDVKESFIKLKDDRCCLGIKNLDRITQTEDASDNYLQLNDIGNVTETYAPSPSILCNSSLNENSSEIHNASTKNNLSEINNSLFPKLKDSTTSCYSVNVEGSFISTNKMFANAVNEINLPENTKLGIDQMLESNSLSRIRSTTDETESVGLNRRCSNIALFEIKKKLSEASVSLHTLTSIIDSLDNSSTNRNSEYKETENLNYIEMACEKSKNNNILFESDQTSLFLTNIKLNHLDNTELDMVCSVENDTNKTYSGKGNNMLQNSLTATLVSNHQSQLNDAKKGILMATEKICALPINQTIGYESSNDLIKHNTSNAHNKLNYKTLFTRRKRLLNISNNEEKSFPKVKTSGPKLLFHNKRKAQSLNNISQSRTCCECNHHSGKDKASRSHLKSYWNKLNPKNLFRRSKYKTNLKLFESITDGSNKKEFKCRCKSNEDTLKKDTLRNHHTSKNDNYCDSSEKYSISCQITNQELSKKNNLSQEKHNFVQEVNECSTSSTNIIYTKLDFVSDDHFSQPVEDSLIKMAGLSQHKSFTSSSDYFFLPSQDSTSKKFHLSEKESDINDVCFPTTKTVTGEKVNKNKQTSFVQKIKRNILKMQTVSNNLKMENNSKDKKCDLLQKSGSRKNKVLE